MGRRLARAMPFVIGYGLLALLCALALQRYTILWVSGGSMRPALMPGDVVVVSKGATPAVGDIALIAPGETQVLHRVTKLAGREAVFTAGDANPVADLNPTPARAVRGKVVRVLPLGSVLRRWRVTVRCATLPSQSNTAKR